MATKLSAMAASSHQRPLRLPPFHSSSSSPPPSCSCSCSAVLCATRICLNTVASTSGSSMSPSWTSSSHLPFAAGGLWRKRRGAVAASSFFGAECAPQPFISLRLLLAPPRSSSCSRSCEQERNGGLGWCWRTRTVGSVCCRGVGDGAQVEVEQVEQEVVGIKGDVDVLELEAELFDFMEKSERPGDFPTKKELIAAGRTDLAEAIAAHGGWLAYGWDSDDDEASGTDGYGGGPPGAVAMDPFLSETNSATGEYNVHAAGWLDEQMLQQQRGAEAGEESGIEGILSRLEKERSSLTMNSKDKEVDSRELSKTKDYDLRSAVGGMARGSRSLSVDTKNEFFPDFDEAGDMSPNGSINRAESFSSDIPINDYAYPMDQSANDMRNGRKEPSSEGASDQNQIHSRLQYLESELSSLLSSLRSRTDAVMSHKIQESSLMELHSLSDAWEFQETDIMNARDKLRSIRAKLTILEGKMALELIEAQKITEEKQKRIDAARRALHLLRTAYVVWPNSASEVLLAGSFDGWNSQRKMERSSTGIFSLSLKLYPGQYEIKFIVDGVWKIDPLRPVVYNNGFENNLLIVS